MLTRRFPHGMRLLIVLALLAALAVAGCGGDEAPTSGAGPDPATVVPAGALLYGEVAVRPEGALADGASAALRKALRVEDPGAEIVRLLDEAFAGQGDGITYAEDVEPWLGDRAGGFVSLAASGEDGEADGAIALAVTDRDELDDVIERARDTGRQRVAGSYREVEYDVDRDGETYSAVVGDFYVGGTLPGLRASIDAARGGDALADAARFADAREEIAAGAIASLYLDPQVLAGQLRGRDELDPQTRRAIGASQLAEADPVIASVTMRADEIAFEATVDERLAEPALGEGSDETGVRVEVLPGDAWLALATPPIGQAIREGLDRAGVRERATAELRRGAGLDLDSDVLDLLGGLGAFVRGTNPLALGGGVLLRTPSDAAARRLLAMLQALAGSAAPTRPATSGDARGFQLAIPQLPQPIVVLAEGAAIAAGYAASSSEDLLEPPERLAESDAGAAAIATLGEDFTPSLVLLAGPLADLLRSLDQLQVADLASAVAYVRAYRSLALGTRHDDDRVTVRAVAALR